MGRATLIRTLEQEIIEEKRLKKDAGRARWGQYFRGLKGPLSPGREKRAGTDSDRDSELELDYAQCEYC